MSSYDAIDDPYCYPGTTILKNRRNLRTQRALTRFETVMTAQRGEEPLPKGRLSVSHFRAVHRHLFQDVYTWAGKSRTVRIRRQHSAFCYPEYIDAELRRLFRKLRDDDYLSGRDADAFASAAAEFLADLNAIHAFRDGNGRAQLSFLVIVAANAQHPLDLERLQPEAFLAAMIESFSGRTTDLAQQLRLLID